MSNDQETQNIPWQNTQLSKEDRQKLKKHRSMVIWFTGLSGSGKSTIANLLEKDLYQLGIHTYLLDGDNLRHGLNKDLGFNLEDRKENIRRMAEVAKLFVDAGMVLLVAAISPFRSDRLTARTMFGKREFIEVYTKCSLEQCEKRDPKGLYKKARSGIITNFTGINQPYEEPLNAEIVLDTENESVQESVARIRTYISSLL